MLPDPPLGSANPPPPEPLDEKVQKLIRYKARRMVGKAGLTQSDVDDIIQEIWLDLLRRWPKYRPERAQPSTFIARLVEHKAASILRYRRGKKRASCRCSSLNIPLRSDDSRERIDTIDAKIHEMRTGSHSREHMETCDLACDLNAVLAAIPPQMQEMCRRLAAESLSAIARDLRIPRTTLQEDVRKIRHRFEDAGLRIYQ